MSGRHADKFEKFTKPKKKFKHEPTVTDHALVRYFERVLNLDVEAIRETILTKDQLADIKTGFGFNLKLAPGITAVVRNGKVVTIR